VNEAAPVLPVQIGSSNGGNRTLSFFTLSLCPLTSGSGRGVVFSDIASFAHYSNKDWTAFQRPFLAPEQPALTLPVLRPRS
jgi:hypothetical protein